MHLHLPAQILQLDHAALEVHEQRAAQLIFRTVDLHGLQAAGPAVQGQVLQLAAHDFEHLGDARRGAAAADAEEARVGVGVVEGDAGLDPAVLVQDVGVQARVHAFAGPAGAEGAAAAEEGLQRCEGVDVFGGDWEGFEGDVDVGEVG